MWYVPPLDDGPALAVRHAVTCASLIRKKGNEDAAISTREHERT
jgi:hypothetical protein